MPSIESFVKGPDNEIQGVEDFGSREILSTVLNFFIKNDKAKNLWERYKGFFIEEIESRDYIVPFFYFFITIYLLGEDRGEDDSKVALSLNERLSNGIEKLNNSINGIDSKEKAIEIARNLVISHISTEAAEFILNILEAWGTIFNSSEELRQVLVNLYTQN